MLLAGTHLDNARVALVCLCPLDPPAAAHAVRATCTCEFGVLGLKGLGFPDLGF